MPHLTTTEAAAELGITRRRVRALITSGRLKAEKFGRDYMIDPADLEAVRDRKVGWPKGRPRRQDGEVSELKQRIEELEAEMRPDVSLNHQEAEPGDDGGFYIFCEHLSKPASMILIGWNDKEVRCPDCGEAWLVMKVERTVLVGLRKNQRTQEGANDE